MLVWNDIFIHDLLVEKFYSKVGNKCRRSVRRYRKNSINFPDRIHEYVLLVTQFRSIFDIGQTLVFARSGKTVVRTYYCWLWGVAIESCITFNTTNLVNWSFYQEGSIKETFSYFVLCDQVCHRCLDFHDLVKKVVTNHHV